MSKFLDYRVKSREGWGTHVDDSKTDELTIDQINCGALLRIADASELMAKNHLDLQRELQWAKDSRDSWKNSAESLQRQNKALKGVITKLKKRLKAKNESAGN